MSVTRRNLCDAGTHRTGANDTDKRRRIDVHH
jgi:hypothetical protein